MAPGRPCRGLLTRRLCDLIDPGHPDYNPRYVPAIIRQSESAAGAPAPATPDEGRPSVAAALDLTRRMKKCDFRSTQGCGCSGGRCSLRRGAIVSHIQCFECLTRFG